MDIPPNTDVTEARIPPAPQKGSRASASASPAPAPPSRVQAALGWLRRNGGVLAAAALFGVALMALNHLLREFRMADIAAAIKHTDGTHLALAGLFSALSYVALAGYDLAALHYVGARVKLRTALFASFVGYAVSNAVGFAMVSGGSVRYRVYTAAGVAPLNVARIIVFCATTFAVGICAVAAAALLLDPDYLGPLIGLDPTLVRWVAIGLFVLLAALIGLAARNKGMLRIGNWRMTLPAPGNIILQIVLSAADIIFSGAVLHVLLPPDIGISFPAFVGVYAAAILAGIISHVPGGVGVFESIILVALSDKVDTSQLVGALVLYRCAYYLAPLLLAGLLMAVFELREQRVISNMALRSMGGIVLRAVPQILALVVFLAGLILLISGATPAIEERLDAVAIFVPLPLLEISHIAGSVAGLLLLLLARGLQQRLDMAWLGTCLILVASMGFSLIKGGNYEEAVVMSLALMALLPCRREFHRRSRLTDIRLTPGWILAVGGAIAGAVWLTFFSFKHVEYSDHLWWQFALGADAPRSLRAAVVIALIGLGVGLAHLLRTAPTRPPPVTDAELEICAKILATSDQVDGHLVFLRDKSVLFSADNDGFLMYGVSGRSWIALGDPIGPPETQEELVWRFRELCDRAGGRPAFYQVDVGALPLYIDAGLVPVKLGEDAWVDLHPFSLEGPARKALRYAVRRAEKDGLSFEVLAPDATQAAMPVLDGISQEWLTAKKTAEKGFSLGAFEPDYVGRFHCAVVRENGRRVAFATLWLGPEGSNAAIDLMRHSQNAHQLTMEYMFIQVLLWAKAQGYNRFGLGMAPLSGLDSHPLAPVWHRIGAMMFQRGGQFYNFQGLRRYKEKFDPVWEPRYLACPGGLSPAQVLLDAAALINGGLRSIITRRG
jgi:phosphatidylglycerol lysyltransferase